MKGKKLLINVSRPLAIIMLFSLFGAALAKATVTLVATATVTQLSNLGYQATVNISNSGTSTAQNVVLSSALLGSAAGTPVPQAIGTIPVNGVMTAVFTFPASAGVTGTAVVERYGGTYTGGTFTLSLRGVLPPAPALISQLQSLIAQAQTL
jgi:hypothetical protein